MRSVTISALICALLCLLASGVVVAPGAAAAVETSRADAAVCDDGRCLKAVASKPAKKKCKGKPVFTAAAQIARKDETYAAPASPPDDSFNEVLWTAGLHAPLVAHAGIRWRPGGATFWSVYAKTGHFLS